MEPLPLDPRAFLDRLAIRIKSIDGLVNKAYKMLRNTCIREHTLAVITPEKKVSIPLEIIEQVNDGNGKYKIEFAKFGDDVNSRVAYDWIKVMCENTGTREKRTSYLFKGVNHQLFAEDEHLQKLTSIVTKAHSAKTKSNSLPIWDIIDAMHTNSPDSVKNVWQHLRTSESCECIR